MLWIWFMVETCTRSLCAIIVKHDHSEIIFLILFGFEFTIREIISRTWRKRRRRKKLVLNKNLFNRIEFFFFPIGSIKTTKPKEIEIMWFPEIWDPPILFLFFNFFVLLCLCHNDNILIKFSKQWHCINIRLMKWILILLKIAIIE